MCCASPREAWGRRRGGRLTGQPRLAGQGGYVLVTVLVALVLLAVVAARLDERVTSFLNATDRWGRAQRAERELANAREQLLFHLVTRQISTLGFGAGRDLIRVDGRPYRMPSGVIVSVQDLRGLISVTATDAPVMRNFLLQQGITDREADGLLDKLADYNDLDTLRRLNGGEASEYNDAGLPPPRNDWPLSPYELRAVLGWHKRPGLWRAAAEHFSAVRDGWINPNTAPPAVLRALPGASDEGVARLLLLREQRHLGSAGEVAAASGIVVPDDIVSFYPGQFYRLRLWLPGTPGAVEYTAAIVPDAPTLPWLTLEVRHIQQPKPPPDTPDVPPFPLALAEPAAAPARGQPE